MILFVIDKLDNESDKDLILSIYEKYAPWLRSRAYNITNDPEISNDLVHDCIINLIKHIDKIRTFNDSQLRAYIAIAIDNTSKNYMKHSSKSCLMMDDDECFFDNIPDEASTEDLVEKKLSYDAIRENFHNLPDRDKDIIILKYDLELSDREIAPVMGIKENSVRMTVRRSIQRLELLVKEGVCNE